MLFNNEINLIEKSYLYMESLRCFDSTCASLIILSAFSASFCNDGISQDTPGIHFDIALPPLALDLKSGPSPLVWKIITMTS